MTKANESLAVEAAAPVLSVERLSTYIHTQQGRLHVVDDVSFSLRPGEALGLVGESGSGKSVTALSLMRLHPSRATTYQGAVTMGGRNLLSLSERQMRGVRGNDIAMVFQDPMVSLNPVLPIGVQLVDAIRAHMNVSRAQARQRAIDLLGHIGIPDPKNRINDYQHQFSGGMRQRVGIALALACEPKVLIADEPTTALDVTVQAQVLALLNRLREEFGMAMILITHDLGIVADVCERVNVMYSGRIVESAPVRPLFARSMMPYTEGLLASVPRIDRGREAALPAIPGSPPRPGDMEAGCRFRPRCPLRRDACEAEPHLLARGDEHLARCWATEKEGWAAR